MKILAVDTSTEACSAALSINGEIVSEYQLAPREHTQLILQMVDNLLQNADLKLSDLTALAFGRGPGSFTGVRIATGVVQGLAYGADLPVVAVSTLASIAQQAQDELKQSHVLAGIDARMGGMYWGCYTLAENGLMKLSGKEQVSAPEAVSVSEKARWCVAGSAWSSYQQQLEKQLGEKIDSGYGHYFPHSGSIARLAAYQFELGNAVDAAQAQPVYLRNDVAKKSASR